MRERSIVNVIFPGLLIAGLFVGQAGLEAEPDTQLQVLSFHRWGHEDGLPDDTVTALLQTQDGYLWIGTASGLARFDGADFDAVKLPTENSNQTAAVTSLCEDDAHRLWVGTRENGLFWLEAGTVHHFIDSNGPPEQSITSLASDNAGQLWAGTTAGLFRVDLAALKRAAPSLGFTNEFISSVHAARSGTIWITTRSGMSQYKNGRITAVEFEAENLGRTLEFIGLYEDRTGSLWAFGDTYLVNLSEGKRFNYFRTGDASSFRIWTLCESSSGQLWIGTSGQGLFAFSDGKFRPLALRENRLANDVRAICEDRQGDLWLGTFGGGLIRLRIRKEQMFDSRSGLPEETASCIAVDVTGQLWAGFQNGGLFAPAGRRFERAGNEHLISSLCLAPDGSAWAGTRGNGLFRMRGSNETHFGTDSGLSSDIVTALAAQPDGAVLIGTSAGVVHRLKPAGLETFNLPTALSNAAVSALFVGRTGDICAGTTAGEVFRLVQKYFEKVPTDALAGTEICALQEDARGRLWMGTIGRGIACRDGNHTFIWDSRSGLPDNDVFGVWPETNGMVWLATGKGIFRLEHCSPDATTGPPVAHLMVECEPTERSMRGFPAALKADDDRLWFAMPGHVVSIDPHKVDLKPSPLPVYIEKVLANDLPLSISREAQPLTLPPRLSSLEIRFAALNLAEPEKVHFQHKLDGFENGWAESGADRRVRYGRLPYGNYTFHVRARNENGAWSESPAQLAFVYPVPAWRSPGALILYTLAAFGFSVLLVWAVSHRRLRFKLERLARQQAMDKERMRIAQDMHDEIGSKLSKIAYLSDIMALRVNGSEVESLNSIAGTSRDLLQSLDEIVWAVNPRNDSLERLTAYLAHYATEYFQDTSVELEMDLPSGLPDHPLSAETRHNLFLAFEEALGNALRHSGATKIHVSMKMAGSHFRIEVRDNGRGFDSSGATVRHGGGNGLANIRERLRDVEGFCAIESAPEKGTTVCLAIDLSAGRPKSA